jgi:hypothetical protein
MSEQELTRAIIDRLNAIPGVWVYRQNTGVAKAHGHRIRFGLVGSADITGVLPGGRRLELEVKLPTGKPPSEEQVQFGERINAAGGLWAVVKSVDEAVAVVEDAVREEAWPYCRKCNTTGDMNWNDPGACGPSPCDCYFGRRLA